METYLVGPVGRLVPFGESHTDSMMLRAGLLGEKNIFFSKLILLVTIAL